LLNDQVSIKDILHNVYACDKLKAKEWDLLVLSYESCYCTYTYSSTSKESTVASRV